MESIEYQVIWWEYLREDYYRGETIKRSEICNSLDKAYSEYSQHDRAKIVKITTEVLTEKDF